MQLNGAAKCPARGPHLAPAEATVVAHENLGVTTMSQNETTDSTGHLEVIDSPDGNLSKLAELARRAYEQKRKKECLDLTRTMLLIDPDHADALWMRSSI